MNYARGGWYAEGAVFSHTTMVSPGKHTYYFEASDIFGLTTRFPETGTLSLEVPVWILLDISEVDYKLINEKR
ncbi:hypothetical protein ACFLYQ_01420 [Chloroflexota bacterium]